MPFCFEWDENYALPKELWKKVVQLSSHHFYYAFVHLICQIFKSIKKSILSFLLTFVFFNLASVRMLAGCRR